MRPYQAFFADAVAETILNLPRRKARKLLNLCEQLASNPFVTSDYRVKDAEGREIDHISIGDFIIAYWVDHPVCKVMIVEVIL